MDAVTEDKIYKLVLQGKIAEEQDVEVVHEKLAIIFDIDLKKIPKLLKKPTIIRKNLAYDVALEYQAGLKKIGVSCEVSK
jgi:predicted transcriptional regulator